MAARWLNGPNMFAPKTPNGSQEKEPRFRLRTTRISEGWHAGSATRQVWVAGCRPDSVRATTSVPRIAANLDRRSHRIQQVLLANGFRQELDGSFASPAV